MTDILDKYLKIIDNYPKNRQSIYLSIGCAAMRTEDINGKVILSEEHYHQFPVCMKKLKFMTYDANMHIILIDPMLEDPPFLTRDWTGKTIAKTWKQEKSADEKLEMYHEQDQNIHVYVLREMVSYDLECNNIRKFLSSLNNYAMINNTFLLIHDFTGRSIYEVFLSYVDEIKDHCDHIVYGITSSIDGGCYINLESDDAQFVFDIDGANIKVLSPFSYRNDFYKMKKIIDSMNSEDKKIALERANTIFRDIKKSLKNTLLTTMRRVKLIIDKKGDVQFNFDIDLDLIDRTHKTETLYLFKKCNFGELFTILCNIFEKDLQQYLIFFGEYDNAHDICSDILSTPDPYQWITVFNKHVK